MNPTNEAKWFLQLNGQVQGPFDQSSIQTTLKGLSAESSTQALIWKRGLTEWVKADKWQSLEHRTSTEAASTDMKDLSQSSEAPEDSLFEKTFNQSFTEDAFYHVQLNSIDQPLMTKTDLMTFIAKQQDVSKISIQDSKTKMWKEVYAFPDIVERLGLSRRKKSRVPILAQFAGKANSQNEISCRVITISQGGIGFTDNFDLKIGDEVEGLISSPHFFQPINIKADVIYVGDDGYIGLKFSQLTDEAKSSIIDYIKKFGNDSTNDSANGP